MKFHSPYQFIPVDTSNTQTTGWRKHEDLSDISNRYIRHDYWHEDALSGRITCNLECKTPMIIGGKQIPGNDNTARQLLPYVHPDGSIAIPGNSLRGMISNIVESISQSAIRVLTTEEKSTYSVRKPPESAGKMQLGLLYKSNEEYRLYPLTESPTGKPLHATSSVGSYLSGGDDTSFLQTQQTFQYLHNKVFVYHNGRQKNALSTEPGIGKTKGILYIRAEDETHSKDMPKKLHETFITWNDNIENEIAEAVGIPVPVELIKTTENILTLRYKADKHFKQLPKGYQHKFNNDDDNSKNQANHIIRNGDLIYYRQDNQTIVELSYSKIWRKPVKGKSPHQAFVRTGGENSLPWNKKRDSLTPAEAIFGVVEDEPDATLPGRNMASRIRFSDATPSKAINLTSEETITLKILDSPKPPSPAMYFHQAADNETQCVGKQALDMNHHIPNGRKQYLPHVNANSKSWETQLKKYEIEKWSQYTQCQLIPEKTPFSFKIHYENLSPEELGLLLKALIPTSYNNDNPTYLHRLGTGKPLGLGQININIEKIEQLGRKQRYSNASLNSARYTTIPVTDVANNQLVDPTSLAILQTIGNPDNIDEKICYPFSSNTQQIVGNEKEGFKWFVENDNKNNEKQCLKQIIPNQKIPTLDSDHSTKKGSR